MKAALVATMLLWTPAVALAEKHSEPVHVTNGPQNPVPALVTNEVTVVGPVTSIFTKPPPPVQAVIVNDPTLPVPITVTGGPLAVAVAPPRPVTLIATGSSSTPTQNATGVNSILFACISDVTLNNSDGLFAVPKGMVLIVESAFIRIHMLDNAFSIVGNLRLVDMPASKANILFVPLYLPPAPPPNSAGFPMEFISAGALHAYIPSGDSLQVAYSFKAGDQQTSADAIIYGQLAPAN